MANTHGEKQKDRHLINHDSNSPSADYGLSDDHGFDPSKYDFYSPSKRTAGKAFVVTLNENQSHPYISSNDSEASYNDFYEPDTPSPLSPIEELDDDEFPAPPQQPWYPVSNRLEPTASETSIPENVNLDIPDQNEILDPLEQRSELLFSRQHLQLILADEKLSVRFADFLRTYRPDSVPILGYYFDSVKALKTIKYAESIIKKLGPIPGHEFTAEANSATMAWVLEDKAERALDVLFKDDLPAFVAYVYVRTVDVALVDRVTGREDPRSCGISNGLAEVFVLSDPARPDNPIVFTSEEFHTMTGYPRHEFLGRNCRVLGGSRTSAFGISRFRASLDVEREHCEVLLNYRKDGSPFINLIMCVPLRDQSGRVRYYLGAQLDVTDLVNGCTGFRSLERLVRRHDNRGRLVKNDDNPVETLQGDEFEQLSGAFNPQELEKLLKLRQQQQLQAEDLASSSAPEQDQENRAASQIPIADLDSTFQINGEGSAPPLGYYKTYLLVRPHPSLRILFASPDLRVPGILQSPLLNRIGGSSRVRDELAHALRVGRKVTAKIQWLSKTTPKSRARWIHCTPLLGANDAIGVWMVILVDDDDEAVSETEQIPVEVQKKGPVGSNYTADALPWDVERQHASATGTSTVIWSENTATTPRQEELPRPQARKPKVWQPSETRESVQPSVIVRPGPRIAGQAYSFTSSSDGKYAPEETASVSSGHSRPRSSNSNMTRMQSNMQPKVRIAGRVSMEGDHARKPPLNLPYRPSVDTETSAEGSSPIKPTPRRTYKSLSPYGILFED